MARKKRRDRDHEHHDHEHHEGEPRKPHRGSFGEYISNWNEYEAPTRTKLALAARNLLVSRWHNRLMCCGHPGQPGC